jgi:beta-glucosidase
MVRPDQQLLGFARVRIKTGETKKITFLFRPSLLAFLDSDMKWKIEAGEMELRIGASCMDTRLRGRISIVADKFIDQRKRDFYCQVRVD